MPFSRVLSVVFSKSQFRLFRIDIGEMHEICGIKGLFAQLAISFEWVFGASGFLLSLVVIFRISNSQAVLCIHDHEHSKCTT